MKKRWMALIVVGVGALVACVPLAQANNRRAVHRQAMQHTLRALAHDQATMAARVEKLKANNGSPWTDGQVGVCADGYVFTYDLHNSHGSDVTPDTNILYLPDEDRFVENHKHFCVDLSKGDQDKDKAELCKEFGWMGL